MTVRNRILSILIAMIVSFITVLVLILLWSNLSEVVGGMNVGLFMLFDGNFWQFAGFYFGLTFILTLVIGFVVKTRWGSRN